MDPIAQLVGMNETIMRLVGRLVWQWRLASLAAGLSAGVIAFKFTQGAGDTPREAS